MGFPYFATKVKSVEGFGFGQALFLSSGRAIFFQLINELRETECSMPRYRLPYAIAIHPFATQC
jgi:hypothetical protein